MTDWDISREATDTLDDINDTLTALADRLSAPFGPEENIGTALDDLTHEIARRFRVGPYAFGPTCDVCGRGEQDSPNILPKMRPVEADWNGETGNHRLCEMTKP